MHQKKMLLAGFMCCFCIMIKKDTTPAGEENLTIGRVPVSKNELPNIVMACPGVSSSCVGEIAVTTGCTITKY